MIDLSNETIEQFKSDTYPRPMLRREGWKNLNGQWKFIFDDDQRYLHPAEIKNWDRTIEVPYCPESKKSGIEDTSYHMCCWYERTFPLEPFDGNTILHFGAVDYYTKVWLNDELVCEHEGGFTPFEIDITHSIDPSKESQKVTVRAYDNPHDLGKPRGKQDWELDPHNIWYARTTGIWQTVWVERVPKTYIRRVRWTPQFERWEIAFECWVEGEIASDCEVKIELKHEGRTLVKDSYGVLGGEIHRRIALSEPGIDDYRNDLLWSPENPNIIDAEISLYYKDKVVDKVTSYTAMRTVCVQRDRFMLNGHPYMLRMVLDQGYWPESLMTPPSEEAIVKDILITKAMGFNGVRKHQKIEDPLYLYWADHLGLVVWEEMPSAYRFSPEAALRVTREWAKVIERDSSHPCIVVWVPINESWGVPNLTGSERQKDLVLALYHLTRTCDESRPVIGNDGWESTSTDIIGIHDYDGNVERLANRYGAEVKIADLLDKRRPGGRILTLDGFPHKGQPVMLTEFGGIALKTKFDAEHKKDWGYSVVKSEEEFEQKFCILMDAINQVEMFAGFCYTQLTDTFQETNGLLYPDRTPKIPIDRIRVAILGLDL